jgi:hypothetical protein
MKKGVAAVVAAALVTASCSAVVGQSESRNVGALCAGEALAQAAHAAFSTQSNGQDAVTGYTCVDGYAAATATNGNYGWTITFRSAVSDWKVLGSANIMPPTGVPSRIYQILSTQLSRTAQNQHFPF